MVGFGGRLWWTGGGSTWDVDGCNFSIENLWFVGEFSSGGVEGKMRAGFLRGVGGWYICSGVVVFRGCASMSWLGLAEGLLSM